MKTILSLNNGHSKVIHGRFGGCEKGRHEHCCDFPSRLQNAEQTLANVCCGVTDVLHGALGVAQFGNTRIEFEVPASGRRRLVLNVKTNEQGFITAAHYG